MKKYLNFIGVFLIIGFSFYYTERVALLVQSKNPIMESITNSQEEYNIQSVDAIIEGNTIIPGIKGQEINANKSFNLMKPLGIFNEYYLVYDEIEPDVSLLENKDKIIISGNESKREVTLIIESVSHAEYLTSLKIPFSITTTLSTYDSKYLSINMESNEEDFETLHDLMSKDHTNLSSCLTNTRVNINRCKENEYFLIKPTTIIDQTTISFEEQIKSGSIIFISKEIDNSLIDLIINEISFKGLKTVDLNVLISENI